MEESYWGYCGRSDDTAQRGASTVEEGTGSAPLHAESILEREAAVRAANTDEAAAAHRAVTEAIGAVAATTPVETVATAENAPTVSETTAAPAGALAAGAAARTAVGPPAEGEPAGEGPVVVHKNGVERRTRPGEVGLVSRSGEVAAAVEEAAPGGKQEAAVAGEAAVTLEEEAAAAAARGGAVDAGEATKARELAAAEREAAADAAVSLAVGARGGGAGAAAAASEAGFAGQATAAGRSPSAAEVAQAEAAVAAEDRTAGQRNAAASAGEGEREAPELDISAARGVAAAERVVGAGTARTAAAATEEVSGSRDVWGPGVEGGLAVQQVGESSEALTRVTSTGGDASADTGGQGAASGDAPTEPEGPAPPLVVIDQHAVQFERRTAAAAAAREAPAGAAEGEAAAFRSGGALGDAHCEDAATTDARIDQTTDASLRTPVDIPGTALSGSADAAYATTTDAAATAPDVATAVTAGAVLVASLNSTAGVAAGLDNEATAAALGVGGAAPEAAFGGENTGAASSSKSPAVPVPCEGELAREGEAGETAPGPWAAESLTSNGEVKKAGDDAGGEASSMLLGMPQQLALADSGGSSYSSVAGGGSGASLCNSYSGGESGSNDVSFNSSYSSSEAGAACSSSCVDFTNNYLNSSSSTDGIRDIDGSSSTVDFPNAYNSDSADGNSGADGSSSADGSSRCELSQQYYSEGGTQQLCVYGSLSGSNSGEGGEYGNSHAGEFMGYEDSRAEYSSSMQCSDSSLVYDSSSGGAELLGEGEMASGSSSIPAEEAAYSSVLPYTGMSSSGRDYHDSEIFDGNGGSAAAAGAEEEEIDAEVVNSYRSVMDADGVEEGKEEQEEQEEERHLDAEEDQTKKKHTWRGVLGIDDLLTERDDDILQLLAEEEPAVPDELCTYFLHRVGCATADRTVARLISIAAQLQVERVIEDAKVFAFCMQQAASAASASSMEDSRQKQRADAAAETMFEGDELLSNGKSPDDVEELDIGSLCAALQKNDDSFCGLSLDCFLDAAPVFLHAAPDTSAAVEPGETAAPAAPPEPLTAYPVAGAAQGLPVREPESEMTPELNKLLEATRYPAGTVPYPVSIQSPFLDMQPSSAVTGSCDVTDQTALLLAASHPESLYTAPAEGYDCPPAASASVNPASFAAVAHGARAFPTGEGVGAASAVLLENGDVFSPAGPVTMDTAYSPVDPMLLGAIATAADTASISCSVGVYPSAAVPLDTSGDMAEAAAASDAAADLAVGDAAAGVRSNVSVAATPFVDATVPLDSRASGPRAPPAAGVAVDSTLTTTGIVHAFQRPDPVSSAVSADLSLAAVNVRVPASTAEGGGADLPAAADGDVSGVATHVPAGDISAAGELSVGSAVDGSVLPAATSLFSATLDAAAQPSPAVAASVLPPATANGTTGTPPGGEGEVSGYATLEATAPSGSGNVGNPPAGTLVPHTPFSPAVFGTANDAPPLDSVSVQTATTLSVKPADEPTDQTPTAFPVEQAIISEPSVVSGTSHAALLEVADSAAHLTGHAARETPAAVEAVPAPPQSSEASADADVVGEE